MLAKWGESMARRKKLPKEEPTSLFPLTVEQALQGTFAMGAVDVKKVLKKDRAEKPRKRKA